MALFEPVASRKPIRGHLIWFAAWMAVTLIGAFLTPDRHGHGTHQQLGLPPCPSVLVFSKPCPGCGLTTSFTAMIHGDIGKAFAAHPIGPVMYLIFTVTAFLCLYGFVKQRRFNSNEPRLYRATFAFAVVFLGFGVFRWISTTNYASAEEIDRFVKVISGQKAKP